MQMGKEGDEPSKRMPYPVSVARRDFQAEALPQGGGLETFDTPAAMEINRARLTHLESLGLPLAGKSVLDVGCGVGHLAQFFRRKGCRVACVDGRKENIDSLRVRYPGLTAHEANAENFPLSSLGTFDIVFCYGLLYHMENPLAGLKNMAAACGQVLLLETIICDHDQPVLRLDDEGKTYSQALGGLAFRPSPAFVVQALNRIGFGHIYAPVAPPDHPDFKFQWKLNLDWSRDSHPLRCVFVASWSELQNPRLQSLL